MNTTFAFQGDSLSYAESPYLENLAHLNFARPQFSARTTRYAIADKSRLEREFFKLPTYQSVGIGFNLFDVGFSLNVPVGNNASEKGSFDFQSSWSGGSLGTDLFVQRQNAVLREESLVPFQTRNLLFNAYYIFDFRKFSAAAPISHTVIQHKSAGSWLLNMQFNRFLSNSDGPIISDSRQYAFQDLSQMQGFRSVSWGIMPGYAYSLTHNGYFVSGLFSLGLAHYWQRYFIPGEDNRELSFGYLSNARLLAGYHNRTFFYGVITQWYGAVNSNDKINTSWNHFVFRIYAGWRFLEKGIFTHSVNDLFSKK